MYLNYNIIYLRMSEIEEQDFIADYVTWMKGPGVQSESIVIYNFGYERPLPFPSIALTPNRALRVNLQTSGIHAQSRSSIAVVGEKYVGKFEEIMMSVDRIHEDTQALPFAIFLQSEYKTKLENMSSYHMHVTPALVGILSVNSYSDSLISRTHTEVFEH